MRGEEEGEVLLRFFFFSITTLKKCYYSHWEALLFTELEGMVADVKVQRDRKDYVLCILGFDTVSRERVRGQCWRCQHTDEGNIIYGVCQNLRKQILCIFYFMQ